MSQKKLMEDITNFWKENKIFEKSVQQRSEKLSKVNYDGPPFASGAPHFGHGLVTSMKDLIGRYNTMKGYKVIRNRGWDCHGLPVEKYVEKKLGIDGKKDIEKMGEEKFIEECRNSIKNTNDDWKLFVEKVGRWADIDSAYFTMDIEYMESVMWIFQNLYNKNLVYKGFKIQGYCPSCATSLANNEINDGYKDRQDPAITVKFRINEDSNKISNITKNTENNNDLYFLAWTTTPWTLPSNMFLAVGENIKYSVIFDKSSKEYYVLAYSLIHKYYKNEDEYLEVNTIEGHELRGLKYEPLFDYVSKSDIEDKYKNQMFQTIVGNFVSTEDGTGIVHQAPAFGEDDFEAVCGILPRDQSREWLFLPVNEYGEFDEKVKDYQGQVVYDANKKIIDDLKGKEKIVLHKSYDHSYPHCRRCDAPLIYKAIDSWFIKEHDIAKESIINTNQINFVPDNIKNRFVDVLKTAPDWNVSRNRYRGAPLPIRENQENTKDRIVIGSLKQLYEYTKDGSNNITQNVLIRHGRTDYNDEHLADGKGKSTLVDLGKQQAELVSNQLNQYLGNEDVIIVCSPLKRCFESLMPYIEKKYGNETKNINKKYFDLYQIYESMFDNGEFLNYLHKDNGEFLNNIGENIYVDYRICDVYQPADQDSHFDCTSIKWDNTPIGNGENILQVEQRINKFLVDINTKFRGKTIIICSHGDPLVLMRKFYKNYDYNTQKYNYYMKNGEIVFHYFDNDRNKGVDLHKPYVDNYTFKIDGNTYKRISEVLDCWFESGSMPFGQVNYKGKENWDLRIENKKLSHKKISGTKFSELTDFAYPADYIIEGLDQTRGWFRTLHILGNGIMQSNSYKNVVINGLILAEDGKKMSKKLKNYPDPDYLFGKYGTDAYRIYLLSGPSVKAEPIRFSESGVEQVFKNFTTALNNVYNFFETYANVDKIKIKDPNVYFIRHAEAEGKERNSKITKQGINKMKEQKFIEKIQRIDPDIIYTTNFERTIGTSEEIKKIMKRYGNKDISIIIDKNIDSNEEILGFYKKIIDSNPNKNVLIVANNFVLRNIWYKYYLQKKEEDIDEKNIKHIGIGDNLQIVNLPSYKIVNDLDKRIIAELNKCIKNIEYNLDNYVIDSATKELLGFIENLTNWYIRRSRRRFWESGMNDDKKSAYYTLFHIIYNYTKISAGFAPFISENIYQKLKSYCGYLKKESVHLDFFPLYSEFYINNELIEEIKFIRKIISLGLYIRSKNNIKVKQPLSKLSVKCTE